MGGILLKLDAGILVPAHTLELTGTVTSGSGLTVIVKFKGVPAQPLDMGVTVIIEDMGESELFIAVKTGRLPLPLEGSPIAELELVQV